MSKSKELAVSRARAAACCRFLLLVATLKMQGMEKVDDKHLTVSGYSDFTAPNTSSTVLASDVVMTTADSSSSASASAQTVAGPGTEPGTASSTNSASSSSLSASSSANSADASANGASNTGAAPMEVDSKGDTKPIKPKKEKKDKDKHKHDEEQVILDSA